jgi:hypothetical protein
MDPETIFFHCLWKVNSISPLMGEVGSANANHKALMVQVQTSSWIILEWPDALEDDLAGKDIYQVFIHPH